ncbi:MAG: UvrABC system protein B [Candidatus Parcubacteria bacterium]|nr:MAG: UvrABC system protein B [Candidatus Parcubacteria bacterium]
MDYFKLFSDFKPTGDQPEAIKKLVFGLNKKYKYQTLLGVTGSGKTYTMASVIEKSQRPALILSPNKILAAQLYQEFKSFFKENSVHYFVSYYDYYRPEAYLPESDTYISKDARINDILDQLRHATIQSILNKEKFIIVSSISCIYGIGDPEEYKNICLEIYIGKKITLQSLIDYLNTLQYQKTNFNEIKTSSYAIQQDNKIKKIFISNPDGSYILELIHNKNTIEKINKYIIKLNKQDITIDQIIASKAYNLERIKIFPAKFFVTPKEKLSLAILNIKQELKERYWQLLGEGRIVEAERLKQRTLLDLEMLEKNGYCNGIENYSRHLSFRQPGEPPYTLLNFLPEETIIFIDESHLSIPQLRAMSIGDRKRKETLVAYGWRLPSAIDNRPLTFNEFFNHNFQMIFVSATPGPFETKISQQIVEQLIRPTGIVDPEIQIKPTQNQILDLLTEIQERIKNNQRILVLTLTKQSAENLTEFLLKNNIKAHYLHSDIKTLERIEIIKNLRMGNIEVLVGVNLLREGLDLPEVSLVAILDADREGFLRNTTTLIQAIGRSARHIAGKVILYADKITKSIEKAIKETNRRRDYQIKFNLNNNIVPKQIIKDVNVLNVNVFNNYKKEVFVKEELEIFIKEELSQLNEEV